MMLSSSSRLSLSNGIPGRRYSIVPRLFGPKWIRFGRRFCRMDQFSTNYVLAILSPGIMVSFCDHQVDRWVLVFVTINIFHYISRFCRADQFSTNNTLTISSWVSFITLKPWCCLVTIKSSQVSMFVNINVCDNLCFFHKCFSNLATQCCLLTIKWSKSNVCKYQCLRQLYSTNVLAISSPGVALWLSSGVSVALSCSPAQIW